MKYNDKIVSEALVDKFQTEIEELVLADCENAGGDYDTTASEYADKIKTDLTDYICLLIDKLELNE